MYRLTGGVPRLINVLCGRAMLAAYGRHQEIITRRMLREVAKELEGRVKRPLKLSWAWGLVGLIGIALGLSAWRTLDPDSLPDALLNLPGLSMLASHDAAPTARKLSMPQEADAEMSAAAGKSNTVPEVAVVTASAISREPAPVTASTADKLAAVEPAPLPSTTPVEPAGVEEPVAQTIDSALSLVGLLDDIANAFTTLFSYWQSEYPIAAEGSACEKAAQVGLQCLYGRGDWDNLRFYNRPAVIELLLVNGRRYHVVVAELDEDQVTLDLGKQRVNVPKGELDPLWSGSYIVLWRPPQLSSEYLKQGSIGPDVHWLSGMLERIDGQSAGQLVAPSQAQFDWQLTERVMNFQREMGLVADGIVGRQTLIKLKSAVHDPNTPALDRG
jgi:general secretion pathway protein A